MRINLSTPFADKDAAKALGARWDSTRKTWYVQDLADLTPFLRWIPQAHAVTAGLKPAVTAPAGNAAGSSAQSSRGTVTESATKLPHCGCKVLPWEDCIHSTPGGAGP